MATKIILKKSSTGGSAPLTSDLDQSELAINLADRKIYTKDNGGSIVTLNGAYVDSVAPSNPAEGDLWYDTANNLLKAHNGSSFVAAGYVNISELEDVTITAVADNEVLAYDSTSGNWINQTAAEAGLAAASHTHVSADITDLETTVEGFFSATNTGTGYGDLSYANGVYTFDRVTDAEIQGAFTAGTGVTISSGQISIGQDVATTSNVTFADVTMTGELKGPATFTIDPATHGDDTGTVVIAGNLTVNGTTTTVSSNEVNIGDSIIVLNSDETGAPSQNGGIEIERGTSANVQFVWNETDDAWDMGNETLQNVVIDGGSY